MASAVARVFKWQPRIAFRNGIDLTHALATRRGVGNAFEANCQHRTGIREAMRMFRTVLKTGFVLAFMAMGTPAFAQQNAAVPDAKMPAGATVSTVQPSVAAATPPADNGTAAAEASRPLKATLHEL